MAKEKVCPECGGPVRGRGFIHKAGCSKATKGAVKRKRKAKAAVVPVEKVDVVDMISGRTKLSTLVRLQAKLDELLAERDKAEVKKVKDALTNVQKLRAELEAAEKLII